MAKIDEYNTLAVTDENALKASNREKSQGRSPTSIF